MTVLVYFFSSTLIPFLSYFCKFEFFNPSNVKNYSYLFVAYIFYSVPNGFLLQSIKYTSLCSFRIFVPNISNKSSAFPN